MQGASFLQRVLCLTTVLSVQSQSEINKVSLAEWDIDMRKDLRVWRMSFFSQQILSPLR